MKNTTKIIIAVSLLILIIFVVLFFLFNRSDVVVEDEEENLFPTDINLEGNVGVVDNNITSRDPLDVPEEIFIPSVSDSGRSKLIKLFAGPVAGFGFAEENDELIVRFVSRINGYIYDVQTIDATPSVVQITNTIIPKAYHASISGDHIAVEYFDSNNNEYSSIFGTLEKSGTLPHTINGVPINDVAWVADPTSTNGRFFYLTRDSNITEGIVYDVANNSRTKIYESDFLSWIPFYYNNSRIALLSKPSFAADGKFILFNPTTNASNLLASGDGLSVVTSSNLNTFVYSNTSGDTPTLTLAKLSGERDVLPITTLADKCAIANNFIVCGSYKSLVSISGTNILPDTWYRGTTVFNDTIVSYSLEDDVVEELVDPEDFGETIDVYQPQVSEDGNIFVFKNKLDESLWAVVR